MVMLFPIPGTTDAAALARAAVLRILLVEKRKQAKLTQAQLAKKLGWEQSTISMLESGQRRIEVVEFVALADVLDFDPVDVNQAIASHQDRAVKLGSIYGGSSGKAIPGNRIRLQAPAGAF
jgi:transcriptional regulator with XRE-family HTH domain